MKTKFSHLHFVSRYRASISTSTCKRICEIERTGKGMNADDTVTIYDVAREAGVSMATVSRVVNGNKNVKENTRKKC